MRTDHLHMFAWSCTYFVCFPAALITWPEIHRMNDWTHIHFLYASTCFPPQPQQSQWPQLTAQWPQQVTTTTMNNNSQQQQYFGLFLGSFFFFFNFFFCILTDEFIIGSSIVLKVWEGFGDQNRLKRHAWALGICFLFFSSCFSHTKWHFLLYIGSMHV